MSTPNIIIDVSNGLIQNIHLPQELSDIIIEIKDFDSMEKYQWNDYGRCSKEKISQKELKEFQES